MSSGADSMATGSGAAGPDLSFIVCTRDRAGPLPRCLDAIDRAVAAAPQGAFELIVVDNGSSDATAQVVRDWFAAHATAGQLVVEPRPGLSNARNAGLAAARGRLLAFTDDDCEVAPDYAAVALDQFAKTPGPLLLGGRVELGDPADLPFTIKPDADPATFAHPMHPGGFILGCNMIMSRDLLEAVGPFDIVLGAGAPMKSAEDTDYVYRAHLAGAPVLYEPSLVVSHFHGRRDIGDIAKLHRGYNIGNGALYAKHGLRHPKLLLHMYWDLRDGLREFVGGPRFDERLGLSHRGKVWGNLAGAWSYLTLPRHVRAQ